MSRPDARWVAVDVLAGVERGGRSDRLLDRALAASGLDFRDRRLATEIVYGSLRCQRRLDRTLAPLARRPWGSLDPEVRAALRVGAYQIACLDTIPAHAAVDRSVAAIKRIRPAAAPLVNGILRAWLRDGARLLDPGGDEAERLQVPRWLLDRFRRRSGDGGAAWLAATGRPPIVALRIPRAVGPVAAIAEELAAEGVETAPSPWVDRALRVLEGPFVDSAPIRDGRAVPRSEAAQLVTELLEPSGGPVLDVCAGRGGKSRQLAERPGTGPVIALDRDVERLRVGASDSIGTRPALRVAADATTTLPFGRRFDELLVDVPCSGLGTIRRHPEIRWRVTPRDLVGFAELQRRILARSLAALAPGGRLLYVTCSTEPEENEEVVSAVLEQERGVEVICPTPEGRSGELVGADGFLRTAPAEPDLDGFFAALLRRNQTHPTSTTDS